MNKHQLRGWIAVSAALLQGKGLRKRSVSFRDTGSMPFLFAELTVACGLARNLKRNGAQDDPRFLGAYMIQRLQSSRSNIVPLFETSENHLMHKQGRLFPMRSELNVLYIYIYIERERDI